MTNDPPEDVLQLCDIETKQVIAEMDLCPSSIFGPRRGDIKNMDYGLRLLQTAVDAGVMSINPTPAGLCFRIVSKDGREIYS